MPLLQLTGIDKSFGETRALKDVDFELREGEVHALVGENGAGKSTLIRILAGDFPPDRGEILLDGAARRLDHPGEAMAAGIGFVHQHPAFVADLSITENFLLGLLYEHRRLGLIDWQAEHRQCRASLAKLNLSVDPRRPLSSLSAHQRQMVALARALHRQPKVLVLDEVTASLSEPEVQLLLETVKTLRGRGVGIVYVSHRLEEVFRIADRVTVLRDGRRITTAPMAEMTEPQLIKAIVGSDMKGLFARRPAAAATGRRTVLTARDLGDGRLRGVDLDIGEHEIVGLAGLGGAGRSRLLKMLFGAIPRETGEIAVDGKARRIHSVDQALRAGIALVTEERGHDGYVDALPIWQNVTLPWLKRFRRKGLLSLGGERRSAVDAARRFSVRMPSIHASMSSLSGGNQQKIIFSRWLVGPVRVLLLDEPTHGVDIGSKSQIYDAIRALAAEGRGVLVASSELEELEALCDRVLLIKEGTIRHELSGTEISKNTILHHLLSKTPGVEAAA